MNEEKREQLQKVLQEHPEINDRLKALAAGSQTKMQEKTIELLKEYGVVLTPADLKAPEGELSDDELGAVAGGGGCGCAFGGGGGGDGLWCGCLMPGAGDIQSGHPNTHGLCVCPIVGVGASNTYG